MKFGIGLWEVGTFELGNEVDVTDPCYDKDVRCRETLKCKPGEYTAFVKVADTGDWGNRVEYIAIYKDGDTTIGQNGDMDIVAYIGVDAGCAGFFNNKPDFADNEWYDFVDKMNPNHNNTYLVSYGAFSDSGYGDGCYDVYANEDRTAFAIRFIESEFDNIFD